MFKAALNFDCKNVTMMTKTKWTLVVALLAFFSTGCATTNTNAKLDYQRLKGSWQWDFPVGYNILTIESVTVRGEKVYLLAYHESVNFDLGRDTRGKGSRPVGTIDRRRDPREIVFKWGRSKSQMDLRWDGAGRLWGTAMWTTWSGDVEYTKR